MIRRLMGAARSAPLLGTGRQLHVCAARCAAKTGPAVQTVLAHAGCNSSDDQFGSVTPPIHFATTFERDADLEYSKGFLYSRQDNPTRKQFEYSLATAEAGKDSIAFASGLAACSALLTAVGPDATVILPEDMYHGLGTLHETIFKPWRYKCIVADTSSLPAIEAALDEASASSPSSSSSGPVLLWLESPSNPLLRVTPLAQASSLAHSKGALVACDSTWMTPVLCRPLSRGVDFVVHSTTKHIGGHSDLLGGALVSAVGQTEDPTGTGGAVDALRRQVWEQARLSQQLQGGVAAPFDAWLAMRGLRTLPARMKMAGESALVLAQRLEQHPFVGRVHYPGLASHAGHQVTREQTDWERFGFGAMLSFTLPQPHEHEHEYDAKGGAGGGSEPLDLDAFQDFAVEAAARVKVFRRATSLGGTESLVEHRRTIEPEWSKTPASLLRVSVGLEDVEDLWGDLEQAIDGAAEALAGGAAAQGQ